MTQRQGQTMLIVIVLAVFGLGYYAHQNPGQIDQIQSQVENVVGSIELPDAPSGDSNSDGNCGSNEYYNPDIAEYNNGDPCITRQQAEDFCSQAGKDFNPDTGNCESKGPDSCRSNEYYIPDLADSDYNNGNPCLTREQAEDFCSQVEKDFNPNTQECE